MRRHKCPTMQIQPPQKAARLICGGLDRHIPDSHQAVMLTFVRPTCGIMFGTHVELLVYRVVTAAGLQDFPESWNKSTMQTSCGGISKGNAETQGPG